MRKTMTTAAVVAMMVALAGCMVPAEPVPTVTVTAEPPPAPAPKPTPEPVETTEPPAPAPEPEPVVAETETALDDDTWRIIMRTVWDDMDSTSQEEICWGWDVMGEDWVVEQLDAGAPRHVVVEFFGGVC